MRRLAIPGLLAAVFGGAMCLMASEETLVELKERAAAARGSDRAKLFMEAARKQIEVANQYYGEGSLQAAQEAVAQAVQSADQACTAARESRKRMKKTEIEARKLSRRLAEIGRTLALADRPQVEAAVDHLEE
ncbi:MAG: hypothetical protein ACRD2R_00630, partial [Terriglobales bacterium]